MNQILKQYEKQQQDALAATIKLNKVTDEFLKSLDQLQANFNND